MDYVYQFLVNFAATTIGVILALLLGRWYDKFKEGEEAESIKAKILIELKSIKSTMLGIQNGTRAFLLAPIKMPIYQGYRNSSKISLLDRYVWYNELLNLYKYLDTYNSWQDIKTERMALGISNPILDQDTLLSKIDKSLMDLEKIVLGEEDSHSMGVDCNLCNLEYCDNADKKGLINCLIAKLSVADKTDLVKSKKKVKRGKSQ